MNSIIPNQRGAALVVSLVMLALLMIIGVTAMRTSVLEGKMATNAYDNALAFQAAETGLRDAEQFILRQTVELKPSSDGKTKVWDPNSNVLDDGTATNWWQQKNKAWWAANALPLTGITKADLANIATGPLSIIEYDFIPDDLSQGNNSSTQGRVMYRITTKGTGGSNQSRVLVQGTYARRY